MVNLTQRTPTPVQQSATALQQYLNHQLTSHQLIQIAETLLESLLEGEYRHEQAIAFIQLRDILSDITTQWECLLGNLHENGASTESLELPSEWINDWLQQIDAITPLPMTETSKNPPTFRINQVGNINTGDVEIQGDQIGTQHNNYAPKQNLTEAAAEIQQLLTQLQATNPTDIQSAIQQEIKRNPTLRDRLHNALKEGGLETLKVLFAPLGIAIETVRGWLETEGE